MKKVLFDANIFIDLYFKREGLYDSSAEALRLAEAGRIRGFVSGVSLTVIYFLIEKELGSLSAIKAIEKIRLVFDVAPVDAGVIDRALASNFRDFEDAVQYYSALNAGAGYLITRNKKDFKGQDLSVLTPEEFLVQG